MKHTSALTIATLVAFTLLVGCSDKKASQSSAAKTPTVLTTFYPTSYFACRIAGGRANIVCPLPAGKDPIFWMPSEDAIAQYQQADLVIVNGASFEKWLDKVSLAPSRMVDSAATLEKHLLKFANVVTHSHGGSGAHSHVGIDGHTWLDPVNAKAQADEIRKALVRLMPAHAAEFQANYDKLAADLDALDASLAALSKKAPSETPIFASHEAYNYLARRYGWKVTSFALDPEAMPDDHTMDHICEALKDHPAKVILWESDPRLEVAARFKKELGLTSVTFSPCENPPGPGLDYISAMKANIARLAAATAR